MSSRIYLYEWSLNLKHKVSVSLFVCGSGIPYLQLGAKPNLFAFRMSIIHKLPGKRLGQVYRLSIAVSVSKKKTNYHYFVQDYP